ncbi:uncharacterized protein TM35_000102370 [Trypanosoma theileri]|uniref:Uncharacterized protein n=1 Tax=Trypanosoma theileri TaxID=67003 RepID=A0A1X0P0E9_9TRYP|nr:uncharacterized protein TM35_000102370 [Trypanosoma theileri]ORC89969.1 hypothetical protein TM35_000102370 [Trypanosoma theileri]
MRRPLCVSGHHFSPENEAILWTHAMARNYLTEVWVPETLVARLQLQPADTNSNLPVGINAANGRRFFYNLSQLSCTYKELQMKMLGNVATIYSNTTSYETRNDTHPLNTNGELFPHTFTEEVVTRFGPQGKEGQSRYWATIEEAEHIFGVPFEPSFLTKANGVTLYRDEVSPRAVYYNVCGTKRPEMFNTMTCCRYAPINFYGQKYSPTVATQLKANAILHGCINSTMWITTQRAIRSGVGIRQGVKPITFCFGDIFHLINVAMTNHPARLLEQALTRTPHVTENDTFLTISE